MLGIEDYNILEASPELSGSMASGLLKNKAMHTFFALNGHIMGSYYHGPNHPCNSENIVADFWKEFTWLLVFLRESGLRGLEPLSQEYIDKCDLSVRKQRVKGVKRQGVQQAAVASLGSTRKRAWDIAWAILLS